MIWSLLLLIVLLGCSGFISGSETALFALTQHDLYEFQRSTRLRQLTCRLMAHPRRVLLTILIVNTTVNILIFVTSYLLFEHAVADSQHAVLISSVGGVIALSAVILFGEVLPKSIAYGARRKIAPLVSPVIQVLQVIFAPIRLVLEWLFVVPLTRLLISPAGQHERRVTTEELQTLVEMTERQGVINPDENDMLQEVLALSEISVSEAMVPRVDVVAFDLAGTRDKLVELFRRSGLQKLPVFTGNLDRVRGIIYARQLLLNPDCELDQLIRPVKFVPQIISLEAVLEHFRETHTQYALAVDEYGGVSGLITLEDVLEQIVGDISDETEPPEPILVEVIDPKAYRMSGDLRIRDWPQALGGHPADTNVATLGGLVLSTLGRLPHVGDTVRIRNVQFTVESMRGRRVDRIIVELLDGGDASQSEEQQ